MFSYIILFYPSFSLSLFCKAAFVQLLTVVSNVEEGLLVDTFRKRFFLALNSCGSES